MTAGKTISLLNNRSGKKLGKYVLINIYKYIDGWKDNFKFNLTYTHTKILQKVKSSLVYLILLISSACYLSIFLRKVLKTLSGPCKLGKLPSLVVPRSFITIVRVGTLFTSNWSTLSGSKGTQILPIKLWTQYVYFTSFRMNTEWWLQQVINSFTDICINSWIKICEYQAFHSQINYLLSSFLFLSKFLNTSLIGNPLLNIIFAAFPFLYYFFS